MMKAKSTSYVPSFLKYLKLFLLSIDDVLCCFCEQPAKWNSFDYQKDNKKNEELVFDYPQV